MLGYLKVKILKRFETSRLKIFYITVKSLCNNFINVHEINYSHRVIKLLHLILILMIPIGSESNILKYLCTVQFRIIG